MSPPVNDLLSQAKQQVEAAMDAQLPAPDQAPQRLHAAMRHALLAGGKRVRPALVLGSCRALGGSDAACLPAMLAIELLHTYTLVHDDLPAMDDDDLRRGQPTVHRAYDEATAILVGDALQAAAFASLGQLSPQAAHACLCVLAQAAGSLGVVGGQQDDLGAEQGRGAQESDPAALLDRIHRRKTAALLRASCHMGAICAGAAPDLQQALASYGEHLGLAFQIIDDLLDVDADIQDLGKTPGKDAQVGKLTWPVVHGRAAAEEAAQSHTRAALAALECCAGEADALRELAAQLLSRRH